MSLSYRVYANNGTPGNPIDWSSPVATTASLSWTSAALLAGTSWRFGVRAFDTVTGLEDQSVDAQIEITLDASRADITGLPPAPTGLTVTPKANGGYRVEWAWTTVDVPTGFKVYVGTPTPNYASAVATVAYSPLASPRYDGTGLTGGTTYQVAVRAYNGIGTETNTVVASFVAASSPPTAVDGLSASAS